jgi:hypothetical protein
MIITQKLVPSVYYDKSRDFQLIGRIYDIVFNYLKANIDTLYNNPLSNNSDKQLIDLLTYTLGFKAKHKYNTNQLMAVCSSLMLIMRNKGNLKSIDYTLQALLKSEGITDTGNFNISNNKLTIYCSAKLSDTILLSDMLDYILPAGMTYNIVKQIQLNENSTDYALINKDASSHLEVDQAGNDSNSVVPTYSTSTSTESAIKGRIDNTIVVGKKE